MKLVDNKRKDILEFDDPLTDRRERDNFFQIN